MNTDLANVVIDSGHSIGQGRIRTEITGIIEYFLDHI